MGQCCVVTGLIKMQMPDALTEPPDLPGESADGRTEERNKIDMPTDTEYVKPPSRFLLAMEGRAILELGAFFLAYPFLRLVPRGDGHPVLVLPGLAASDASTQLLRAYLKDLGYASHGWDLGHNLGHHHTVEGDLRERLLELHKRYGRKVSVVGWSLGGVFARELAKTAPRAVRVAIALGSPIACCARSTNAWRVYELTSGKRVSIHCRHKVAARKVAGDHAISDDNCDICGHGRRHAPTVPSTSIFSRTDGIVAWPCTLELEGATTENIEIEGSHSGLGHNPLALYAIADRLAQPEGAWKPFDRSGWRSLFYPDPKRGLVHIA